MLRVRTRLRVSAGLLIALLRVTAGLLIALLGVSSGLLIALLRVTAGLLIARLGVSAGLLIARLRVPTRQRRSALLRISGRPLPALPLGWRSRRLAWHALPGLLARLTWRGRSLP